VIREGAVDLLAHPYLPTFDAYVSRIVLEKRTHIAHVYFHRDDWCSMRNTVAFMTAIDPEVQRIHAVCPAGVCMVFFKVSDGIWDAVFRIGPSPRAEAGQDSTPHLQDGVAAMITLDQHPVWPVFVRAYRHAIVNGGDPVIAGGALDLNDLVEHPDRIPKLTPQERDELLTTTAAFLTSLARTPMPYANRDQEDVLLTVKEAAKRLSMSVDYLYKHADEFSFTVRHSRSVRFSSRGIDAYLAAKQRPT
jgi:hypothetical protein